MPRRLTLALMLAALLAPLVWMFAEARQPPVVRRLAVPLADWPAGEPPVRAVLLSDVHFSNAATDARRLAGIVDQINALAPDLVLIAGDMIPGHDPHGAARIAPALVAPLARLRARLGVVAVLGNHDNWTGPADVRRALMRAGATVLDNQAVTRGPLAIGGAGDVYSHYADLPRTLATLAPLKGARILLTHSPDLAPKVPSAIGLTLAGHTHCAQIWVPWIGLPKPISKYGLRYRCGVVRERGHVVVVTAGVGTSQLPLRFNAPPDIWLLTLGPR